MADSLEKIEQQISELETQAKNTETLYTKIQGALEALAALKNSLTEEVKKPKETAKK